MYWTEARCVVHGVGALVSVTNSEVHMTLNPTIREWPAEDRPREKLLDKGAQALTDTELLAIILRIGNASTRESAVDHARQLLRRFGGLQGIDEATADRKSVV